MKTWQYEFSGILPDNKEEHLETIQNLFLKIFRNLPARQQRIVNKPDQTYSEYYTKIKINLEDEEPFDIILGLTTILDIKKFFFIPRGIGNLATPFFREIEESVANRGKPKYILKEVPRSKQKRILFHLTRQLDDSTWLESKTQNYVKFLLQDFGD